MCKIIGIYGEPGTGRKTAAWLLAKTIEEIKKKTPYSKYRILYKCWCQLVIRDEEEAYSTSHCILDSFGGHILDQLKIFCPILGNLDLTDDSVIYNKYINMQTWEVTDECSDPMTLDELLVYINNHQDMPRQSVSLADFIMYFAKHVMKKMFGDDVWLRVAKFSNEFMDSEDYRIYYDVKTQGEQQYVDYLVHLQNADRAKDGGYREIIQIDSDFTINTIFGLENCAEDFHNIALMILNSPKTV